MNCFWAGPVEDKLIFNLIYREGKQNLSYVKRFKTPKFILEKEYHLFPPQKRSFVQYLSLGEGKRVRVYYVPSRRASPISLIMILSEFLVKGAAALGKRLSNRVVRRLVELEDQAVPPPAAEEPKEMSLFKKDSEEGKGDTADISGQPDPGRQGRKRELRSRNKTVRSRRKPEDGS